MNLWEATVIRVNRFRWSWTAEQWAGIISGWAFTERGAERSAVRAIRSHARAERRRRERSERWEREARTFEVQA